MDSLGSLVDTNLRIFPTKYLLDYLKTIPIDDKVPLNIAKLVKGENYEHKYNAPKEDTKTIPVHLNSNDIENLNKIKALTKVEIEEATEELKDKDVKESLKEEKIEEDDKKKDLNQSDPDEKSMAKKDLNKNYAENEVKLHLNTADIDWLYTYLHQQRKSKEHGDSNVPYLHALLEGASIQTPENQFLERNPVLEARCVKLRSQQQAREYRKMTKSVDNVRIKFPEDSISYQCK